MKPKTFHFSIECDVSLDVSDIWPNKNAPDDPTLADVLEAIRKAGGAAQIIRDWSLADDLCLTVSDGKNSEVVK